MKQQHDLKVPPWLKNPEGKPRRVGIELEMSGLDLNQLAAIVADFLQLEITSDGRYARILRGDAAGEWVVELDFNLLKKMGRKNRDASTLEGGLENSVEEAIAWAAESIVPMEIVSPPLPFDRLPQVEDLIAELRATGARGTSDHIVNAFGMQLNPEIPATDPAIITAILKTFLCCYDWIVERTNVDLTRRITSYVDPFPHEYILNVVNPAYQPDLDTLIDDYLQHNPTRNRALDMLPLFLHLDKKRVRNVTADELIKPRPTFHYRLPNCDIHKADWGLHLSWNDWVRMEALAADSERLNACCERFQQLQRNPLRRWFGDWPEELENKWLAP
ncbi:MAG: amidoligase family protein [Desulfuromonadales bacterium]|nr:amidoligase family protein [Desulfuromonadales bacterium]